MESGNPWAIELRALVHMASDSGDFTRSEPQSETYPELDDRVRLFEAKSFGLLDHRSADFPDDGSRPHRLPQLSTMDKRDPSRLTRTCYRIPRSLANSKRPNADGRDWLLAFRDVTDSRASARTCIASFLPDGSAGNTAPVIEGRPEALCALGALLTSVPFDYFTRQKIAGLHLTFSYLKQLPVPSPGQLESGLSGLPDLPVWLKSRLIELAFTAWDLSSLARDLGFRSPPFVWDEARRALVRAELDACFFHLYGIEREDVDYIMETFPIVKRKDEAAFGEYRTKRLILEVYDAMAEAIETGKPYQTILDPPPADPSLCHPESTRPDWATP